jgi:hypothetical protein
MDLDPGLQRRGFGLSGQRPGRFGTLLPQPALPRQIIRHPLDGFGPLPGSDCGFGRGIRHPRNHRKWLLRGGLVGELDTTVGIRPTVQGAFGPGGADHPGQCP